MGGPFAHGVLQGMRKQGTPEGGPPPPRWRMWFYVIGIIVLSGALGLGAYYC